MRFYPLTYIPLEIRMLQSLDKHSKDYKNAIKEIRLGLRKYACSTINGSEVDEFSCYFRDKYKKYLLLASIFLAGIIIVPFVGTIFIGDYKVNEFAKSGAVKYIMLVSTFTTIFSIAMVFVFSFKAKKVLNYYIDALFDQAKMKCSHFSDQLLSDVIIAFLRTRYNHQIKDTKQKCGCINCQKIFYSDEIRDYKFDAVVCPYCSTDCVIAESSGYPITNDFLSAMKEYWIET